MLGEAFPGEMWKKGLLTLAGELMTDQRSHSTEVSLTSELVDWGHLKEHGQLSAAASLKSLPCHGWQLKTAALLEPSAGYPGSTGGEYCPGGSTVQRFSSPASCFLLLGSLSADHVNHLFQPCRTHKAVYFLSLPYSSLQEGMLQFRGN